MRTFIGTLALVLVSSMPAFAQRMGSANRNAPTISQSITFGKDTIEIAYTSITWAEGNWAKSLADEAKKSAMRDGINKSAEGSPLGSLKTSCDIMLGGQKVAAGSYKLAFILDEQFKWQIRLTSDAGKVTLPLDMKAVDEERKRLLVNLRAGEKDFTAEVGVAFGKTRCILPLTLEKSSS